MYNLNTAEKINNEVFDGNNFAPWIENPFKLWSLMELLEVHAEAFIALGRLIEQHITSFKVTGIFGTTLEFSKQPAELINFINIAKKYCVVLNLPISEKLWSNALQNPPQSHRELDILIEVITEEISSQLFFFIPSNRADYYDWKLIEKIKSSVFPGITPFPNASKELMRASRCYTKGEYTACVFHTMRAAEIGLRALAIHLGIVFPFEITLAQWNDLITKVESTIKAQEKLPKSKAKDEELKFCSEAASQFRYFKNAYRIFVAHARESYDEDQALKIMQGTGDFIVSLSPKLKEVEVSP
jgi:HEPN domain-containing protein